MSRFAFGLFLALPLATLTGCPSDGRIPCSQSADCPNRVNCVGGFCQTGGNDGGSDGGNNDGGTGNDGGIGNSQCTGQPTVSAGTLIGPSSPPAGCQTPRGTSTLSGGNRQELGSFATSANVSFSVPAQTWSLTIVSQAVSAGGPITYSGQALQNTVFNENVRDSANATWYRTGANPNPPESHNLFVAFAPPSPHTNATTIPNTSQALSLQAGGYPQGTWNLQVMDFSHICTTDPNCSGGVTGSTYQLTVLTKSGTPPATGSLDVDFYLVTNALALNRTSAVSNARVQRMVSRVTALFAQQGVCLGNVQFFDVPQWAKDAYSSTDIDAPGPCRELSQMFTLSQANRRAVPVFLVDSLTTTGAGGTVLGVDGTIPGPASIGGTIASGVAVTAANLLTETTAGACSGAQNLTHCGADQVGFIVAHEIGHFMGLFHTTESYGDEWDTLLDTPYCLCSACRPASATQECFGTPDAGTNPYLLPPSQCRNSGTNCRGAENLMFWAVDGSSVGQLTQEQGRILRASPAVQ